MSKVTPVSKVLRYWTINRHKLKWNFLWGLTREIHHASSKKVPCDMYFDMWYILIALILQFLSCNNLYTERKYNLCWAQPKCRLLFNSPSLDALPIDEYNFLYVAVIQEIHRFAHGSHGLCELHLINGWSRAECEWRFETETQTAIVTQGPGWQIRCESYITIIGWQLEQHFPRIIFVMFLFHRLKEIWGV